MAACMSNKLCKLKWSMTTPMLLAYAIFASVGFVVFHHVAEQEFSAVLTFASIFQSLGLAFLCIQVVSNESVAGISAGSLTLDGFAFAFRLSSTTWLNGYIPTDPSGDHVYQIMDVVSLIMVSWLLHQLLVVRRATYQATEDTLNVRSMVLACLGLAALFHGDMNDRPLFDTTWMTGLFCGVVAVLPQLWMTMHGSGRTNPLTSHYIATLALSRLLSGSFFWYARNELTCNQWIMKGFSHASWAILAAHVVHLILLSDFAYRYVTAMVHGDISEPLRVGTSWGQSLNNPSVVGPTGKWV